MATSATILGCRFDVNLGVFMTPGDEAAVWALRGEYDGGRHMRPGVLECREHDTKPELARYRCDGVYTGRRFGNLDGTRCPRGSGAAWAPSLQAMDESKRSPLRPTDRRPQSR
jgi:hypothetical protein